MKLLVKTTISEDPDKVWGCCFNLKKYASRLPYGGMITGNMTVTFTKHFFHIDAQQPAGQTKEPLHDRIQNKKKRCRQNSVGV